MTVVVGDLVALKSGGVTMTVSRVVGKTSAVCMYYNSVSGKVESIDVPVDVLRSAYSAPISPTDASRLRGETTAKSTL